MQTWWKSLDIYIYMIYLCVSYSGFYIVCLGCLLPNLVVERCLSSGRPHQIVFDLTFTAGRFFRSRRVHWTRLGAVLEEKGRVTRLEQTWQMGTRQPFEGRCTPWKFNSSPLKIYTIPKGESSLPSIIFQGLCLTSGGYTYLKNKYPIKKRWFSNAIAVLEPI